MVPVFHAFVNLDAVYSHVEPPGMGLFRGSDRRESPPRRSEGTEQQVKGTNTCDSRDNILQTVYPVQTKTVLDVAIDYLFAITILKSHQRFSVGWEVGTASCPAKTARP